MQYVRIIIVLLFFVCHIADLRGNHLVGGEFELVHVEGNKYELRLIQYRDALQQENTVIESSVTVRIFQKSNNQIKGDFNLYFESQYNLPYNNPGCTDDVLKTNAVIYAADITLEPDQYNHEEGYYVAWERCCRNNAIDNIVLNQPNTVGMTYYMEFPPVVKDGKAFQNSSPEKFQPLKDYACVGMPYSADFSGTDEDGDSLVYSLATPLDSSSDEALPTVTAAPYPLVPWASGFNQDAMISGQPSLRISRKGQLTVTPNQLGLFVFSVNVEEYRNKVKIGEVRRDFQLLVVDCPPQSKAPQLGLTYQGNKDFDPTSQIAVLGRELSDAERCVEIFITDEESTDISTLKAVPQNVGAKLEEFISISSGVLNATGDTIKFQVCFGACPVQEEPYLIDFIASDNACPSPLYDTIRATILVEQPQNHQVYFNQSTEVEELAYAGNLYELPLQVLDDDGDLLELRMVGADFDTSGYNIRIDSVVAEAGKLNALFSWNLDCNYFDLSQPNSFSFFFIADDQNPCDLGEPDTLKLKLNIEDLFADFENFEMPNVFTPNGDGLNDFFGMCSDERCNETYILPPDNCQGSFMKLEIYNRWGKKVYDHKSRDFRWDGSDNGAGVYYYSLKYTHKEFKGQISLIK